MNNINRSLHKFVNKASRSFHAVLLAPPVDTPDSSSCGDESLVPSGNQLEKIKKTHAPESHILSVPQSVCPKVSLSLCPWVGEEVVPVEVPTSS